MGIIAPKELNAASKVLLTLLLISLSPILFAAILLYFSWGAILYLTIWLTSRKQFVIFVYSDSPTWKEYIETEILPNLQDRAVILNWSERRNWKYSLAVLAFRYFGGYRNFNPIALVFRPFRFLKAFRFFEAFKEYKRGNPENVQRLKKDFFAEMGI